MKSLLRIFLIPLVMICTSDIIAQHNPEGFNYASHQRMNKKAGRWSHRRMKASGGDQVNLKCSVRKSRQYARRKGGI